MERRHRDGDSTRYCMLCETYMTFEPVEPAACAEAGLDEWICVTCGSAVCVDPPTQLAASA